mgnify:CR=1 FL=1
MTIQKQTLSDAAMSQFTGTAQWYRHPLARDIVYTDGAKYVAEEGGAYWLLDEIALTQKAEPVLEATEFQVWTLIVASNNTAVLSCEDGNGNEVYSKKLEFTDFPLPEIKFWFFNNTILLPSEW